jgi:hypothetical protein
MFNKSLIILNINKLNFLKNLNCMEFLIYGIFNLWNLKFLSKFFVLF